MNPLNVLIGCECTAAVREAFRRRGHNAWSCDLKPSEVPGNHYQCDLLSVLDAQAWDVLCNPVSGLGYQIICPRCSKLFGEGKDGVRAENSTAAGHLKIECGCTVHLYKAR